MKHLCIELIQCFLPAIGRKNAVFVAVIVLERLRRMDSANLACRLPQWLHIPSLPRDCPLRRHVNSLHVTNGFLSQS